MAILSVRAQIVSLFEIVISLSIFPVFVTSKSCIYITPSDVAPPPRAPQITEPHRTPDSHGIEPIYENIENGNIVPCDDNKFTIYVSYDFIKGGKSSVRLLEPDVRSIRDDERDGDERINLNVNDNNDDGENHSKPMSKMIQCQQISMYIGEKKALP